MILGRSLRRLGAFLVRNWPLKLAAFVVATLLYVGLVVSQDSAVVQGPIRIVTLNQPGGTQLINELRDVDEIRYVAPADAGRLRIGDFRVTIDLSDVAPTGDPATVNVSVQPLDPRVTVIDYRPRSVQVVLDELQTKTVAVRVDEGTVPTGIQVGDAVVDPTSVTITGPASAVRTVVEVVASVRIDPSGVNVDRMVNPTPTDDQGHAVIGVNLDPTTIHVQIPLFTNRQSRSLPVIPTVTGTPAPGFRIGSVSTDPLVVSLVGNLDALAALAGADTAAVLVAGATSDVDVTVGLTLPTGVLPLGNGKIHVRVHIVPVTETRTYAAGFRLDGRSPDLLYALSNDTTLLTLFGSVADLDRLASAPLVVGLDVSGLAPGTHKVSIVPSLPTGMTVAAASPAFVTVTVTLPPSPTPSPAPTASPSVAPSTVP
jgi:YbbR domain-containing protein